MVRLNRCIIPPLFLPIIMVIAGCDTGGSSNDDTDQPALYNITVTAPHSSSYLPTQLIATGRYDDDSEKDISSLVNWNTTTIDSSVATLESGGLFTPVASGDALVSVFLEGIYSDEITVTVGSSSSVCGHVIGDTLSQTTGVNDTDNGNAAGACLKVRQIEDNSIIKWFTSSPSLSMAEALGYVLDNTTLNSGKSYHSALSNSSDLISTIGTYVKFRQDGAGVTSNTDTGGQYYRWCENLSDIEFAGVSNWRRATHAEMKALFSFENSSNKSLYKLFGWPVNDVYKTSTPNNSDSLKYTNASLLSAINPGDEKYSALSNIDYVSCVANVE